MKRRQFLKLVGSTAIVTPIMGSFGYSCSQNKQAIFASAYSLENGTHYFAGFDLQGNEIAKVKLPSRGHGAVYVPKTNQAIIIARRPDRFLFRVDVNTGEVISQIESGDNRHFFGHGALSSDGKYLYTSENDYQNSKGLVVKRDAETLKVIEEYDSGGIGPHEIKLLPDGETLVIANGGIKTHPDSPRKKLNLDSMKPNLAYLNTRTGQIEQVVELPDHKLSIRHIDVDTVSGKVVVGTQYQGDKYQIQPLIYVHKKGENLRKLNAPDGTWRQMNQYTASVCVNSAKNTVAVSCPRGDVVTVWDLDKLGLIETVSLRDCAGICLHNGDYIVSTGNSQLMIYKDSDIQKQNVSQAIKWDNHMIAMS